MSGSSLSEYLCIDIEASGLGELSYPIELAIVDPSNLATWSWLIKPPDEWIAHRTWDFSAEEIHGISRDNLLRNGQLPSQITDEFCNIIVGKQLVSDAPSKDRQWLDTLLTYCSRQGESRHLHDLEEVELRLTFLSLRNYNAARLVAREKAALRYPKTHRALADALHNAEILRLLDVEARAR